MKLVVGLGNPGKEYEKSRHNIGFKIVDNYCEKENIKFKKNFCGLYAEKNINGEKVIFLKPQTFMNLSGQSVIKCKKFYDIDSSDIIVIHDDMDIDLGNYKLKSQGSSAGHNGIKNIIEILKTENFKRFRVGISKNQYDKKAYVLGNFTSEENKVLEEIIDISFSIISDYIKLDFNKLMNKYN